MPHAVEYESMGQDDKNVLQQFIRGDVPQHTDEFDQTDKAPDAVDYEDIDISDEDLPEEEEATGHGGDDEFDRLFSQAGDGLDGLPTQPPVDGQHEPSDIATDLFGDLDESGDLFGDLALSAEDIRPQQNHMQSQQRPVGLTLPSKSALSLPTLGDMVPQSISSHSGHSPSSSSPHSYQIPKSSAPVSAEITDEEDDSEFVQQRRLFNEAKRRFDGETVDAGPTEMDMELFYELYPSYDETQAPRFTDLFPPRNVTHKGKVPPKPPKPVMPTKISLDLLQDQEKSFRSLVAANKTGQQSTFNDSILTFREDYASRYDSDDDLDSSVIDDHEMIGGTSMQDIVLICQDWDVPSVDSATDIVTFDDSDREGSVLNGDWENEEHKRPNKRRRTGILASGVPLGHLDTYPSFEDPQRTALKLATAVSLDLNDPNLLIDEHAPRKLTRLRRAPGDKRDAALSRDIAKRYNVSNDEAYKQLKENHQSKVRSTLGGLAIEHSFPATKLQYPFYQVGLDAKAKRSFHRPHLDLKQPAGREYRFQKPKHIKRKHTKGREAKEIFAKAEDLSLGDNAAILLLEYSEEAPMMMSNFGMGNRLINYYRKKGDDDNERPKRDIGEPLVLLSQDKSPFSNFGHVDHGETVPTIQNGLFRAPVFAHQVNPVDFIVGISSTFENGDRLFLRNVENLHTVGQQLPLVEIPGQHSRRVTDAAKKRLRALAYRIYNKSLTRKDKVLDNASLMPHLPGHDMPQTRSKMREFMKYERVSTRGDGSSGVWVPQPGQAIPDADTLRSWIRPEDVCLLDSMQVGVQHLGDLGIKETKEADDDKELDDNSNIEQQLAPWRATKNFLNACQGKAMLTLHGDGDPTGRGQGFSFVKTSMKGGFQAVGESVEDKLTARKRKENGGHSYNVAAQQRSYDESIRRIWDSQKVSLSNTGALSDDEDMEDVQESEAGFGRGITPRSSFSTPAAFASRHDDEYVSQFSGHSAGRGGKTLNILRSGGLDEYGRPREDIVECVTDPRVIKKYKARNAEKRWGSKELNQLAPTGDKAHDQFAQQKLLTELARVRRNAERREAREKQKANNGKSELQAASPSVAASPGFSELDGQAPASASGAADSTPQKGKGRSKDGTQRKCANCGQVGHIKTNRKSVSTFVCPDCQQNNNKKNNNDGDSSHGRNGRSGAKGTGSADANGGKAVSVGQDSYSAFVL